MAARSSKRKVARVAESSAGYSPRRVLLDTHAWLWWYLGDRRLGPRAQSIIKNADEVRFSAASAWEIAIERSIGKLAVPGRLHLARELERDSFIELAVSVAHAEAVHALPRGHGDPFDRLLVAQAQVEGLAIVTADDQIARYDVAIIDARR